MPVRKVKGPAWSGHSEALLLSSVGEMGPPHSGEKHRPNWQPMGTWVMGWPPSGTREGRLGALPRPVASLPQLPWQPPCSLPSLRSPRKGSFSCQASALSLPQLVGGPRGSPKFVAGRNRAGGARASLFRLPGRFQASRDAGWGAALFPPPPPGTSIHPRALPSQPPSCVELFSGSLRRPNFGPPGDARTGVLLGDQSLRGVSLSLRKAKEEGRQGGLFGES